MITKTRKCMLNGEKPNVKADRVCLPNSSVIHHVPASEFGDLRPDSTKLRSSLYRVDSYKPQGISGGGYSYHPHSKEGFRAKRFWRKGQRGIMVKRVVHEHPQSVSWFVYWLPIFILAVIAKAVI